MKILTYFKKNGTLIAMMILTTWFLMNLFREGYTVLTLYFGSLALIIRLWEAEYELYEYKAGKRYVLDSRYCDPRLLNINETEE